MSLTSRINNPDRRQSSDAIVPLVERRGGEERREPTAVREPRWLTWTRENDTRGKSLDTGRAA